MPNQIFVLAVVVVAGAAFLALVELVGCCLHAFRRRRERIRARRVAAMMAELRRVWYSPGHPGHGCSGVWVAALHGLNLPLVSGD